MEQCTRGRYEALLADLGQRAGALLLASTYDTPGLRAVVQRLRRLHDDTRQVLSVRPSPAARSHYQRAARALAEAELALWVVEGLN